MKADQEFIFYAVGKTVDSIDKMPQTERVKDKEFEILYLTDDIDEFALQGLMEYQTKAFKSVSAEDLDIDSEEEKEEYKKKEEESKDLIAFMKEHLGDKVSEVKLSNRLKSHAVCLTAKGGISLEMEKVLSQMPGDVPEIKAARVLELNADHEVWQVLQAAYPDDKDKVGLYTDLLYNQALLIEGLAPEDPAAFSNAVCSLMK